MTKRVFFLLAAIISISLIPGLSFASPLTDYSIGKTEVTIINYPDLHMEDQWEGPFLPGGMDNDGKSSNLDWDITTGMGKGLAVQYRQFNPKTLDNNSFFGMKTQELNVLYRIDSSLSAFIGLHRAKYIYDNSVSYSAENKDVLQGGIIGKTKIAPKTQLFGVWGIGKKLFNFETGIAYEIDKHIVLNLVYRYKKVEDMDDVVIGIPYKDAVTAHGYGLGVTYKF